MYYAGYGLRETREDPIQHLISHANYEIGSLKIALNLYFPQGPTAR